VVEDDFNNIGVENEEFTRELTIVTPPAHGTALNPFVSHPEPIVIICTPDTDFEGRASFVYNFCQTVKTQSAERYCTGNTTVTLQVGEPQAQCMQAA
jgi:hypothetical protein